MLQRDLRLCRPPPPSAYTGAFPTAPPNLCSICPYRETTGSLVDLSSLIGSGRSREPEGVHPFPSTPSRREARQYVNAVVLVAVSDYSF